MFRGTSSVINHHNHTSHKQGDSSRLAFRRAFVDIVSWKAFATPKQLRERSHETSQYSFSVAESGYMSSDRYRQVGLSNRDFQSSPSEFFDEQNSFGGPKQTLDPNRPLRIISSLVSLGRNSLQVGFGPTSRGLRPHIPMVDIPQL
jgi:hypothetical protein